MASSHGEETGRIQAARNWLDFGLVLLSMLELALDAAGNESSFLYMPSGTELACRIPSHFWGQPYGGPNPWSCSSGKLIAWQCAVELWGTWHSMGKTLFVSTMLMGGSKVYYTLGLRPLGNHPILGYFQIKPDCFCVCRVIFGSFSRA